MLDVERCHRVLGESFPELDVNSVRYFAEGWDYELWEVNGGLLFRFPKRAECAEPVRTEARLLSELAGTLSVPVPHPEYVSEGCDAFPLPFFAYRKLAGTPLNQVTLSDQARRAIAHEVGRFLNELHRFPTSQAAELGVPVYTARGWREHYREFREQCDRNVLPLLEGDERAVIEAFWQRFLDDERHFRFKPVLIHADLGLEHILVDPEQGVVAGIIDFADAMVGDPALDFTGFDARFRKHALSAYGLPVDDTLLPRAGSYWKISPFHEVLFGLHTADQIHINDGLAGIRREIVAGK